MARCEVTLNTINCLQSEQIRTRCFVCGGPSCTGCSRIVKRYAAWQRVRICNDCLDDNLDIDE